jgi:hypothetical protein
LQYGATCALHRNAACCVDGDRAHRGIHRRIKRHIQRVTQIASDLSLEADANIGLFNDGSRSSAITMNELYEALLSWAVVLTGYSPQVVVTSHAYLEQQACEGRRCKVMGWYPSGSVIYIDEALDVEKDLYASSVVVHEMVHYLQQASGRHAANYSCEEAIEMEREAYAVQQAYLIRYGVYRPIGSSMHYSHCKLTSQSPH